MSNENSQFDISGIQLRESKTQPKVSLSREIGEAEVVETIFGRAKVRIIRKNDKFRRSMWMAAGAGTAVIAFAVWQGWYASQQAEPVQNTDPSLAAGSEVQAAVLVADAASATAVAAELPVKSEPVALPPMAQMPVTVQPQAVSGTEGMPAKPVVMQPKPVPVQPKPAPPAPAVKPQTVPVVANSNMQKSPPVVQSSVNPALPKQHPAASSPAAATPGNVPVAGEDIPPKLPEGDQPLSDPVNVQIK
ncbi:MAG: hypothetical protein HZB47_09290 [Nitrosomonadales bacterium]|nr:hypothetical protein [Nitrosomonadales bacterium]